MGKRTQRKMLAGGAASFFICLGLLAVCFFAGVVWGQVSAEKNAGAVVDELQQYLVGYYALEEPGSGKYGIFLSALLIYFRYPLLAFLLGIAVPGALLLPGLSVVFGFFLSFSACCFAGAFGEIGVLMAAAVLGFRCIISLPCFFVIAVPSFQNALWQIGEKFFQRGKQIRKPGHRAEHWLISCMIAAILFVGALIEVCLSPVLLEMVFPDIRV